MYKCPFCGAIVERFGFLKMHVRTMHRENPQCPICGITSKNIQGLMYHCFISNDEMHKALYYLIHKNGTSDKVKVKQPIKTMMKYKHLFMLKEGGANHEKEG